MEVTILRKRDDGRILNNISCYFFLVGALLLEGRAVVFEVVPKPQSSCKCCLAAQVTRIYVAEFRVCS